MAAPPILATLSFGLLLLLLSAPPVRAAPLSRVLDVVYPSSLPPPWQDTSAICTPFSPPASADPTAALCDPSAFLSSTQILALSDTLARVFAGVSPYSLVSCPDVSPAAGFRVAVAAVRSMPYDENSVATRAQIYADTLFTQWGLADNCGASVLLFLAVDDRRLYIKTGVLAADYVSNSMINLIFSAMASPLTVGDINGALVTAVTMITAELSKYDPDTADDVPPADTSSDDQDAGSPFDPIFFKNGPEWWDLELSLVALVSFAALVLACCNGVGGPDQARKKKQIRELLEKLDVVRTEYIRAALPGYEPDSCPISQQPLNPNPAVLPTTPISSAEDSLLADDSSESERQTVRFPCGHVYIKSWLDNFPREREDVCPVSGISSSDPNPPSLADTRVNDLAFRLNRLKEEYPQLITPAVFSKLSTVNPSTWPDRLEPSFLTVSNTSSRSYSAIGGGSVGGSGTGNLLTGLGLGALGGFLFGNALSGGGGSDQTATSDAAGWVGQQDVSGLGGGGGGGAAFGDGGGGLGGGFSGISGAISQATNTFGGGWGFGGSQDGGGGGGGGGF